MTLNKSFNFTEAAISKLEPSANGKRYEVRDTGCKGLACRVTGSGIKTYCIYKKIKGQIHRITIGETEYVSLKVARSKAIEYINLINSGKSPNQEQNKLKKEITLGELFNDYLERHAKKYTKERTWRDTAEIYNRYLSHWGNKKISTIAKIDIENLHTKLGNNNGHYAANSVLTLITHVYNKAIEWGWEGLNPTNGIKKYRTKSRDRFLQKDEIERFFNALDNNPNDMFVDYVIVSLLTGQRKSNVLSMKWDNINLKQKVWHIPDTKNNEPLNLPLSDEVLEILIKRFEEKESDVWVFPSPTSASGHYEEPKRAWSTLLKEAQLTNFRIHDLRRTLGSYQAILGSSMLVIGKSLGHKTSQATQIYARLSDDPVRESINNATKEILKLGKRK